MISARILCISKGLRSCMGGNLTIGPDYLEVVSFIGAAVVTHGSIRIHDFGSQYLQMIVWSSAGWASSGR